MDGLATAPPDDAATALAQGTSALVAGRVAESLEHLRRAVTLDPAHRDARFNLAVALRAHGMRDEALRHARAAVSLDPGLASAHVLVGTLIHLAGDVEGAERSYRRATAADPGHRGARYALGVTLCTCGRREDGVTELALAIAPGPRPLTPLVRERARGILHDAKTRPAHAAAFALCNVPLLTEIATGTGLSAGELGADAGGDRSDAPSPSRSIVEMGIDGAAEILARSRNIVALTGAGISSGSGLRTRKDLWREYSKDDAVSVWRFHEEPAYLWNVVRDFLGDGEHAPNAAHHALAALPGLAAVLTQNVDDLHQRADPRRVAGRGESHPVIELHGTLEATRCHACGARSGRSHDFVRGGAELPPRCARCDGVVRPDVVLFGEHVAPDRLAEASRWAERCDVMLVVGCAMDVAPASELPRLAAARGAYVLEIKRTPSRITSALGGGIVRGVAEDVLPRLRDEVARRRGESCGESER